MVKEVFIRYGDDLLKVSHSKTLHKLLCQCISTYFLELKDKNINIGYVINPNKNHLAGAKAKEWIVLFVPKDLPLISPGLKWVVVHELCHFINLHNPNKIFRKKVPENVWKMWNELEKRKELICDAGGTI